jgi:hypothetical protein
VQIFQEQGIHLNTSKAVEEATYQRKMKTLKQTQQGEPPPRTLSIPQSLSLSALYHNLSMAAMEHGAVI